MINADIAEINQFNATAAAPVEVVDAKINGVRKHYEHHFNRAKTARETFERLPLVLEVQNAIPKLVKKIYLEAAKDAQGNIKRPLQWTIVLEKLDHNSNDPRFAKIDDAVTIQDEGTNHVYPVVIR